MLVIELSIIGAGLLATFATGIIIDYWIVVKQTRPK